MRSKAWQFRRPLTEFPNDTLPPESSFMTKIAALSYLDNYVRDHGYTFVKERSTKAGYGRLIITYLCNRHTPPKKKDPTKIPREEEHHEGRIAHFQFV